ncbi:M20/M25/M40 family metallo-hydrolase [Pseudoneobacillus sp. C159]
MDEIYQPIDLFQKLIQIDTTNQLGTEEKAVIFLQEILQNEGIHSEIIYSPNGRANLVAKLETEISIEKPLVLLSHVDVVSANGEEWTHPPFSGVIQDRKIWGRGTLDTKQLTVMHLLAFLKLYKNKKGLNRTVYFITTADEENGSVEGMEFIAGKYPELFRQATVLSEGGGFVLQGSDQPYMLYASGEKGTAKLLLKADGTGGHAGSPPDRQAIVNLSLALEKLLEWKFPSDPYEVFNIYSENILQEKFANKEDQRNLALKLFEYMKSPSVVIENIEVGGSLNVIPYRAEAQVEIRTSPHQTEDQLLKMLDAILDGFDVTYELLLYQKGYESSYQSPIIQLFQHRALELGFTGKWVPFTALGKTDGRFISQLSPEIYGLSPVLTLFSEVLTRVHHKDECLEIDSFLFGVQLMERVVQDYCIQYGGG